MAPQEDALALAWQYQQAGNLWQAEQLCRQILAADPAHAEALHLLGVLAYQGGRPDWAVIHFQRALQTDPANGGIHCNLGTAYQALSQRDEAIASFRRAVSCQPDLARAWYNLGNACREQGLIADAFAGYENAARLQPDHVDAHNNLGSLLAQHGRLDEAVAHFQQALQLRPDFQAARSNLQTAVRQKGSAVPGPAAVTDNRSAARSLNNRGVELAHQNRLDEAAALFEQALQIDPDNADAHNNRGSILVAQRNFAPAIAYYRQVLRLRPDFVEAHYNLGIALQQEGRLDEAIVSYQNALRLRPDHLDARNNLGDTLKTQGKLAEAIACYEDVLRRKPDFAEVHCNLGIVFAEQHDWARAEACYQEALRLKPGYANAYHSLGVARAEQAQFDEAIGYYQQALRLQPGFGEAHNSLGNALRELRQLDEAIVQFQHALRLKPGFAVAHNNLGIAFKEQGRLDEAIAEFQHALRLKPDYPEARTNLGNTLKEQGRFTEAMAQYEQALQLRPASSAAPELADPHFNRALLWLLQGDFQRGWAEYEWRWQTRAFPRFSFRQPRWDGAGLNGRTILLLAEQGLGDSLQFLRYARLVKERGGSVVVECQPAVLSLAARCPGVDRALPRGAPLPDFDVHAPLLSLPGIFGTSLANIPSEVPYLFADATLIERWRQEMNEAGFKIGIAWQGSPSHKSDRYRSVPLAEFASLAAIPGVRLFSLQVGSGSEQLAAVAQRWPVADLGSQFDPASLADAAAAMLGALDLVVTVDTALAHLAGALAVPVWVLLQRVPDWRWLLEREDSPWYPTMRLFRQTRFGDWGEVFARLQMALRDEMPARAGRSW